MMQKRCPASLRRTALAFGAFFLLIGAVVRLPAQQADPMDRSVTFTVRQKPLADALEALMQAAHVNYIFKNNLPNPKITAGFSHVSLRMALNALLKASELSLTYRYEGGIYYIFQNEKPQEETTVAMPAVATVQDTDGLVLSLDITSADLFKTLAMVMKQAGANYTIDDSLKNAIITAHTRLPLRETLNTLAKASGNVFTYSVTGGVYHFVLAKGVSDPAKGAETK